MITTYNKHDINMYINKSKDAFYSYLNWANGSALTFFIL